MLFITEDATVACQHVRGIVTNKPSQNWFTIQGRSVLVEIDPEGRQIKGCPNVNVGIRPCVTTLQVITGYSNLIRVGNKRVALDTVTGLTDGTPPGLVRYEVKNAGQPFVQESPAS